jgi:D-alanyl-lipoteichoic acid acyltransferase DltB (MBOAT superfamily)
MRAIMLYIVYGALHIFVLLLKHHWAQEDFLHTWKSEYLTVIVVFILTVIVVVLYVFEILAVYKLWRCVKAVSDKILKN